MQATLYSDPACPWAYSAIPALRVLEWRYDPAIRAYSTTKQVSSFAAVFPTEGPLEAPRYFVLILLDDPHATARTFGFATGGWGPDEHFVAPGSGGLGASLAAEHRTEPAQSCPPWDRLFRNNHLRIFSAGPSESPLATAMLNGVLVTMPAMREDQE